MSRAKLWNAKIMILSLYMLAANLFLFGFTTIGGFVFGAHPSRLMAPIIGINPNGLPLEANSPLQNSNVILPGILITAVLYVLMIFLTSKWFEKRGN